MTDKEIAALDRRNTEAHKFVVEELGAIKKISLSNQESLVRVDEHLKHINGTIQGHEINFGDLNELLRGAGKDDAGMVGEQIKVRAWIKETKDDQKSTKLWMRGLVGSVIVAIIINVIMAIMILPS